MLCKTRAVVQLLTRVICAGIKIMQEIHSGLIDLECV